MGLSLGVGVALAAKKKKKLFYLCLIGDGECNEGSVWEAAMSAPHFFELNNLTVILDNNNLQQTGTNHEIMTSDSLAEKWSSFNWNTIEVDGHNTDELKKAFDIKSKNQN